MRPKNIEKENAIRRVALQIIAEQGLENLTMQKLAEAANVSPRTIYIKYENKEDFLLKLFINEVLVNYEKAVLEGFREEMDLETGIRKIWSNTFLFLKNNKPAFALMRYGKASPLLNKAFREENIEQGQFFSPIHNFLEAHMQAGAIHVFPQDVYRSLLLAPLIELVNEYFDYEERPEQIITEEMLMQCCTTIIKGIKK
jgi:AcrR family transcriptional regulator